MSYSYPYVGETRAACGWCGKAVLWSLEGDQHLKGVCIDPTLGLWKARHPEADKGRYRYKPPKRRATVLTLFWKPTVTRDDVHRLSEAWSAKISAKDSVLAEVRMQIVAEDNP